MIRSCCPFSTVSSCKFWDLRDLILENRILVATCKFYLAFMTSLGKYEAEIYFYIYWVVLFFWQGLVLDSCYSFHSSHMHFFNCRVLLNFVRKLRCPIHCCIKYGNGTLNLKKMVFLVLLTWQLINWNPGYTPRVIWFLNNWLAC